MPGAQIIELSRTIRLYLPSLLPAAAADVLDRTIADLLVDAEQSPDVTAAKLEQVLNANRITRAWLERTLRGADPSRYEKRLIDITTPPQPIRAPKYECGTCGYVWYRRNSSEPPLCPQDGCALAPDGGSA